MSRFDLKRALCVVAWLFGMLLAMPALADDARYAFPQQYSMSPKGVNLQTGRFMYSKTDISIGNLSFTRKWGEVPAFVTGRSLGLIEAYNYNPDGGWGAPTMGWSHNFNQGIVVVGGDTPRAFVVVDGSTYTFWLLSGAAVPIDQPSTGTMLTTASGKWVFTNRDGTVYTFTSLAGLPTYAPSGWLPQQALESVVSGNGSRISYTYNSSAQPSFISSNSGYAIKIDYDGNTNVSAVCGFNLAQTYVDASTSCAGATLKTTYAYESSGRYLQSVTDPRSKVVTISYTMITTNSSAAPACISLPNSSTCEISNTYGWGPGNMFAYADQVASQTTATGNVYTYSYIPQPDTIDQPVVPGQPRWSRSNMQGPLSTYAAMKYDRGRLVNASQPAGIVEYRYKYRSWDDGGATPTTYQYFDSSPGLVTMPEGNREYFEHDNRGNITLHSYWPKGAANPASTGNATLDQCCIRPESVAPPAGSVNYRRTFLGDMGYYGVTGATYVIGCGSGPADSKLCNKPLTSTDANGNVTDYTYDQATGLLLTETGPAVNGIRPQVRYTYAPFYAWIKTAGGGYLQAATPVWLLTQTSTCKTGAASGAGCAIAGDEVRTLYDYGPASGPNNLLLRGTVADSTAAALRTCYSYDWQGNKISETKPRAGLGSCP